MTRCRSGFKTAAGGHKHRPWSSRGGDTYITSRRTPRPWIGPLRMDRGAPGQGPLAIILNYGLVAGPARSTIFIGFPDVRQEAISYNLSN